jgi:hypothetical protein
MRAFFSRLQKSLLVLSALMAVGSIGASIYYKVSSMLLSKPIELELKYAALLASKYKNDPNNEKQGFTKAQRDREDYAACIRSALHGNFDQACSKTFFNYSSHGALDINGVEIPGNKPAVIEHDPTFGEITISPDEDIARGVEFINTMDSFQSAVENVSNYIKLAGVGLGLSVLNLFSAWLFTGSVWIKPIIKKVP